jgi:hypothetical protein
MPVVMLSLRFVLGVTAAAASVAAMLPACDDSYRPPHASGGATGSSGTAHGGGGGVTLDDGSTCILTCSNDLKSVIDCKGVVQKACDVTQGCANGVCVDGPCMAAEVSKSSYGCDYWALKTAQRTQADGACFVAFVANTWGAPVHLAVERDGKALDPTQFAAMPQGQGKMLTYTPYDAAAGIPVGQVAILFLSRFSGGSVANCPVAPSTSAETGVSFDDTGNATGVGQAFHIGTDYPVVVYQMTPYGGGTAGVTSATLLLPTSAWDNNYIAINAYEAAGANTPAGYPSLDILAHVDGTQVTILPKVAIVGGPGDPSNSIGPVAAAPAGAPATYTLNKGEFLQITQPEELTGSPIQSNQPIAVFGASACMEVPVNHHLCDSGQQQLTPVRAMGNEYVAVRYRGRGVDTDAGISNEATQWRLVGAVDGTTLTWEPSAPPGAPMILELGDTAEFTSPGPFVVKSQDLAHPFYLGAYMTGGGDPPPTPTGFAGEGDPDWVNVITPPQFLDDYVFFTDQTYPETDLVLIRTPSKVDGSFADVTLTCAGGSMPSTVAGWQKIGIYEYTRVDLSTGDFTSVGGCTNGRQELKSALPFGVTVWGWGHASDQTQSVSYAYPAGAGFQPINTVVVPTTK